MGADVVAMVSHQINLHPETPRREATPSVR